LKKLSNVELILNAQLVKITGDNRVNGVDLNTQNGIQHYDADGVFIAIGTVPATDYLKNLSLEFENAYVVSDETGITNVNGVFVAGDIRKKQLRQAVTAVADGANSATSAINYLVSKNQ
jgi:thioredoxin reductase (NADPH)